MGIEFELKFRATPEQQAAIRQETPGEETRYVMATTYYDTHSGAMSARKYTLRQRMENECSVCTLKTQADSYGRREFEVNCPSIQEAIPSLCQLSGIPELPQILEEGLRPVCGAAFTRIAKTLVLPKCTLELALDTGILTGGGKELPLCEVEVELKDGDQDAAIAFATRLSVAYGLTPEKKSKFVRAQALAKGE